MLSEERRNRLMTFFTSRKKAYQFTFDNDVQRIENQIVLRDLAKFCRANDTTFHPDPRVHAALEGRREVWLRIQQYLELTPEQLIELFGKD